MPMVEVEGLYNHHGSRRLRSNYKMSGAQVFIIGLFTCCFTLISVHILGDIFIYDYTNFATDASAINNKAASGPIIALPSSITQCGSVYALSDSNKCIRSRAGLYLNRGITSPSSYYVASSGSFDSYFKDHDTNSIAARIFVNPHTMIGTPIHHRVIRIYFNTLTFALAASYNLGAPGTQGVRLSMRVKIDEEYFYYETSTFLILSASWVDVVVMLKHNRNAVAKINMAEKVYSSGWNDVLPQLNTDEKCPDLEMSDEASGMVISITNYHYTDFTILYFNIYGGAQTLDSISSALCENPYVVPPEYCSKPSTSLLANGCTSAVNHVCRSNCKNVPCEKYKSPLTSKQAAGVAVAVAFAVDAVLVGLYLFFAICLIA